MAGRGRAALTDRKAGRNALAPRRAAPAEPRPLLYTAQDLARFCEVDLKTIHHWADAGKIPHHRTEGRHLRFRRNHVLAFLRHHGYPVHVEIASARPTVFFAVDHRHDVERGASPPEEIAKKLSARFFVRRFESAAIAIAHLVAGEPDVLVVSLRDPSWNGPRTAEALKAHADTSWTSLVVVADDVNDASAGDVRAAGADLVIGQAEIGKLSGELARSLGVD